MSIELQVCAAGSEAPTELDRGKAEVQPYRYGRCVNSTRRSRTLCDSIVPGCRGPRCLDEEGSMQSVNLDKYTRDW